MNREYLVNKCTCGGTPKSYSFRNPLDSREYGYLKCKECKKKTDNICIDFPATFSDVILHWNKMVGTTEGTRETYWEEERSRTPEDKINILEKNYDRLADKLNEVINIKEKVNREEQNLEGEKMNEENNLNKLKRCPGCGSDAQLITYKDNVLAKSYVVVKCKGCLNQTKSFCVNHILDFDVAVQAWNNQGIIKVKQKTLTEGDRIARLEKNYERLADKLNEVIKKQNRLIDILSNLRGRPIIHTPKYEPYTKDDELDF